VTPAERSGTDGPPTEVEPDYRFTLANERTFLAWQRTALGLVAGGVALDEFARSVLPSHLTSVLAVVAVVLGGAVAALGLRQWATSQRAMRRGEPLPPTRAVPVLAVVLALVAVAVAVGMVIA
jgi:putative membrane protein